MPAPICAPPGGASPELEALANRMEKEARDLRLRSARARTGCPEPALHLPGFADSLEVLQRCCGVPGPLEAQAERSEGLAACARRAATARSALAANARNGGDRRSALGEGFAHGARLHLTPLSSAELFRRQMADHPRAWIFTSATLAVGEDFGHFTRELGLGEAQTRRWASPFDFPNQALLYLPKGLPADPNDAAFTDAVVEAALPVIEASGGRAFAFHHTARRQAHERLRGAGAIRSVQAPGRAASCSPLRSLGKCGAAGASVLGRGRVRGEASRGGDRQAAVRAARRNGARGAHEAIPRAAKAIQARSAAAAGVLSSRGALRLIRPIRRA